MLRRKDNFSREADLLLVKTQELAENAELYNHELSRRVVGCAIEVHRNLGPGLFVKLLRDLRALLC